MINHYSPAQNLSFGMSATGSSVTTEVPVPTAAVRYPSPPVGLRMLRLQLGVLQRVAPKLAFQLAWRVFCTPRRLPVRDWEAPVLREARQRFVATALGPVAMYEWGPMNAPVVLLVHGWEHRASFWGAWVQPLLAAGYRVAALDGPGHGASAGRQVTLVDFAGAVQAVLAEVAGSGPVQAIVAHSFGAASVAGLPVQMPVGSNLPRLVLMSMPLNLHVVATRFTAFMRQPASMVQRMETHIQRVTGRPSQSFAPAVAGPSLGAEKVLIVHDEHDAIVPFAEGKQVAADWPGITLYATKGLGHNRILRDAGVVQNVLAFLKK